LALVIYVISFDIFGLTTSNRPTVSIHTACDQEHQERTRSQAVARIADRTASQ